MFASLWLAHAQLRVLPSTPMDREHHIARLIVDVYDDIRNQCSEQLLTAARANTRCMPSL